MKICFTSALFCDPSEINKLDKPGKFKRHNNFDYVMFTNLDANLFDTSWDVVNISDNKNIVDIKNNIRKSRYTKFLSWDYFEKLGVKYDVIFYCDAWVVPNYYKNWVAISQRMLEVQDSETIPFIQTEHNREVCRRGGINVEFYRILLSKRDTESSIDKTRKFFQSYEPSVSLDYPQYFENTCFGYVPSNSKIRTITKELWEIYTKNDVSYRDQPLWNFLLLKHNVKPLIQNDFKDNTLHLVKHYKDALKKSSNQNAFKMNHCWFNRLIENEGTMREDYTEKYK